MVIFTQKYLGEWRVKDVVGVKDIPVTQLTSMQTNRRAMFFAQGGGTVWRMLTSSFRSTVLTQKEKGFFLHITHSVSVIIPKGCYYMKRWLLSDHCLFHKVSWNVFLWVFVFITIAQGLAFIVFNSFIILQRPAWIMLILELLHSIQIDRLGILHLISFCVRTHKSSHRTLKSIRAMMHSWGNLPVVPQAAQSKMGTRTLYLQSVYWRAFPKKYLTTGVCIKEFCISAQERQWRPNRSCIVFSSTQMMGSAVRGMTGR